MSSIHHGFFRSTYDATPADLLVESIAAESFTHLFFSSIRASRAVRILGLGLSTPIESENKSDMDVVFSLMLVENPLLIKLFLMAYLH